MRLKFLRLLREVRSPEVEPRPLEPLGRDVFIASDALTLEDLGDKVRISGAYGVRLTGWANVVEAEPEQPSTETAKAAASAKARGATTK